MKDECFLRQNLRMQREMQARPPILQRNILHVTLPNSPSFSYSVASESKPQEKLTQLLPRSTGMFYNLTHNLPIPNDTLDLLRHRLFRIIILIRPSWNIDVDARALTRKDLGAKGLPAQVYLRRIDLVEHDRRQCAENLHLELRTLDHVDAADQRVNGKGYLGAIVERYRIRLADDPDGGLRAPRDEDGVGDLGFDLQHAAVVVVILDQPFGAVELLSRWFLRPHALGFSAG